MKSQPAQNVSFQLIVKVQRDTTTSGAYCLSLHYIKVTIFFVLHRSILPWCVAVKHCPSFHKVDEFRISTALSHDDNKENSDKWPDFSEPESEVSTTIVKGPFSVVVPPHSCLSTMHGCISLGSK